MDPDLVFPLFNAALTHLLQGDAEAADSLYTAAMLRHGLPEETAQLLRSLPDGHGLTAASRKVAHRTLQRAGAGGAGRVPGASLPAASP